MIHEKDIQIISENSDLSVLENEILLQENIYAHKKDWIVFLRYFFLSLGVSFIGIGIVFFFAYNWQDLHKFVKLGIIDFLILTTVLIAFYFKEKPMVFNILLTVSTLLVGVLFAVFGQIYQTGANAYDFFLGWTIAVFLWVLVANFEPLWLFFIGLLNITYFMFTKQIVTDWHDSTYFMFLLLLNLSILATTFYLKKYRQKNINKWFLQTLELYVTFIATYAIIQGVYNKFHTSFIVTFILVLIFYISEIILSFKEKNTFYIATVLASFITIIASIILKSNSNSFGFLTTGIFLVISVTATIKLILFLKNKWENE